MKSGDIILAVGGKPTLEMTLQEAVSHIRGPKGSEVVLTILHRDSKEPRGPAASSATPSRSSA